MADLSIQVSVTATVGGKSFRWTRTGSIADISSASTTSQDRTPVSGGAHVIAADPTFVGNGDTPVEETAAAFICVAGTGAYGALSFSTDDVAGSYDMNTVHVHGMPLLLYTGYDFNGAIFKSTTATDTPTDDIGNVSVVSITGPAKFQALVARKPIS